MAESLAFYQLLLVQYVIAVIAILLLAGASTVHCRKTCKLLLLVQ